MLDTQINMYSVDTGHFYSNHEKYLHEMNCKYRRERNYVNNMLPKLEEELVTQGYNKDDFSDWKHCTVEDYYEQENDSVKEYMKWCLIIKHKREKANLSKEKLLNLLSNKTIQKENLSNKIEYCKSHNIPYDKKIELRELRKDELNDNNIISVFESSLTRIIDIKKDELTDALIVVQVYYFDVFKDLSFYGFMYNGEKYRYFTSFLRYTICTISTTNSATSVPIAAPDEPKNGINIALSIKSTIAPAKVDIITAFSFPIGISICIPIILVKPINKSVGITIIIGTTAPPNASPDKKSTPSLANIIKYIIIDVAAIRTNFIAFLESL